MMFSNSILLALLPTIAVAFNDWSVPCTSGVCSYEAGDGKNTPWSTLIVNALSPESLSDITSAAGWEILNCDETSKDPQDIRLVCVDQEKGCSHLFEGGADDTVIRLPESCAGGPFARVTRNWVDEDQSLPARLAKRGQTTGKVRGLALDFDFAKIPESRGKVYMTVAATNSPAQRQVIRSDVLKRSLQPLRHANRRDQADAVIRDFAAVRDFANVRDVADIADISSPPIKRSPFSIGDVFNGIGKAVNGVVDFVGDAAEAVGNFVGDTANAAVGGIGKVIDAAKTGDVKQIIDAATGAVVDFVQAVNEASRFDKSFAKFLPTVTVDKSLSIVDQAVDCPNLLGSVSGNFKIDASFKASVTPKIGFIASGTLVPPNPEKLAFTGGFNGNADAAFTVSANAQGNLKTPSLRVFEIGIPGLDFPGILAIGPTFSINTFVEADLDVVADLSLSASLDLSAFDFAFPSEANSSVADVKPKKSPLKIDIAPSELAMTANFTLHVIPRIDLGVTILSGVAKATVFADIDASAKLDLSLNARSTGKQADGSAGKTDVGGTVGMTLGLSSKIGAEAALLPFFSEANNLELFNSKFDLFSKDFGELPPTLPEPGTEAAAASGALNPAAPVDSAAPVNPTAPVDSATSAAPVDSATSAAPVNSAAPVDSAAAVDPTAPVGPVPIPTKRSVLPGRHSKRSLVCKNSDAVRGVLASALNVVVGVAGAV